MKLKISPLEISLGLIGMGIITKSQDTLYLGLSSYQSFYINNVRMDKKYEKKQTFEST